MTMITDGTGTGNKAKVNSDNKLETVTISTDIQQAASLNSELFRISTPMITLTSDSESQLLYVKNDNANKNLIVPSIIVAVGGSTGADDDDLVLSIGRANPIGGTIISNATAASLIPLNLAVTSAPAITAYTGVEGDTATFALDVPSYAGFPQNSVTNNPFFITVTPGNSFVLSITPPTSNTSMNVQLTVRVYFDTI